MGASKLQEQNSSDDGRASRFRTLARQLQVMAEKESVSFTCFSGGELPFFTALDSKQQDHVLWQLGVLVAVARDLQAQNLQINKSRLLTWGFFKHTRLTPPSDLMEKISEQDSVDIYNEHHQLIFANLRFFQIATYSLEDLYCRPWMELFGRDNPMVHQMLYKLTLEVMHGQHLGPVNLEFIPTHIVFEASSPRRLAGFCRPRWFSPLFEGKRVAGYLCINSLGPPVNYSI